MSQVERPGPASDRNLPQVTQQICGRETPKAEVLTVSSVISLSTKFFAFIIHHHHSYAQLLCPLSRLKLMFAKVFPESLLVARAVSLGDRAGRSLGDRAGDKQRDSMH